MSHFATELFIASMCPCHDPKHCCLLISILFWESGKLSKRFTFKYLLNIGSDESSGLTKSRHASKSDGLCKAHTARVG